MARYLCLIALVAFIAVCSAQDQQQQQQCKQEFRKLSQCIRKSGSSGKQQYEQCFTNAGCSKPQSGGPGGRQGPNPSQLCFQKVKKALEGPFKQCLQQKGVSLPAGNNGGQQGQGGQGGFGGQQGQHDGGAQYHQNISQLCNNDPAKVQQVKACLQQTMKAQFTAMCQAKTTCQQQAPISQACKDQEQKFAQAMCECEQQLKPQSQQAFQNEPSCANVQKPFQQAQQQHQQRQRDCSKPQRDMCAGGGPQGGKINH